MAIPKIIHYCWLSDNPMTIFARECVDRWRRMMPDYELRKWDKSTFDISSVAWVHEAYEQGKYAFASDYIRLYALYHFGGFYLDTDIVLKQGLDQFTDNEFVSFIECSYTPNGERMSDVQLQAAMMGSVAGHPFLAEAMRYYEERHYDTSALVAPIVLASIAEKYGLRNVDEEQRLDHAMHILPSHVCAPSPRADNEKAVAIHYCEHSWRNKNALSDLSRHVRTFGRGIKLYLRNKR